VGDADFGELISHYDISLFLIKGQYDGARMEHDLLEAPFPHPGFSRFAHATPDPLALNLIIHGHLPHLHDSVIQGSELDRTDDSTVFHGYHRGLTRLSP